MHINHARATGWTVAQAPSFQPVSLDLAYKHLRLDCDDNEIVGQYIAAAVAMFEDVTGRALAQRELFAFYDEVQTRASFPVATGTEILAVHARSDPFEIYESQDLDKFSLISSSDPGGFMSKVDSFPFTRDFRNNYDPERWRVRYRCGFAEGNIPFPYIQAILAITAHWYEQAAPVVVGTISTTLPFHLQSLMRAYKVYSL